MCIHYHFDGFSSLLADLVSGKKQFGFLWLEVSPVERAYGRWGWFSGIVFPPFVKLCTVQGALSPRMSWQILHLKQSWCISKPLSEWGRVLWQLLSALRFSRADRRGAAEWASTGLVLINDANTAPGAMSEQTGVMSALATDGRAPFPVLHWLLQHLELLNKEQ